MTDVQQPVLKTPRLTLREFVASDAESLQEQINHQLIYDTTDRIPHPYTLEMAERWIGSRAATCATGDEACFAITLTNSRALAGCIALHINQRNRRGTLGYWVGVDHWSQGYVTEAVAEVIRFGFEERKLNRIDAQHLARNKASGRVMHKCGMRLEAEFKDYAFKHDVYEDVSQRVIYRSDFETNR